MSEYNSLYINIQIEEAKLRQFFEEKPAEQSVDKNWLTWWDSRKMYGKQPLDSLRTYQTSSNRVIFDELLLGRDYGASEHYNEASKTWIFISVFFSENYQEILPLLALLKNLASHQDMGDKGVAMIYDHLWGSDSVMAYLEFTHQQARLKDYTQTAAIELSILHAANQSLEKVVNAYNKKFNR